MDRVPRGGGYGASVKHSRGSTIPKLTRFYWRCQRDTVSDSGALHLTIFSSVCDVSPEGGRPS